jgi:hypothetical protein
MKRFHVLAAALAVLASCAGLEAARDEGDARWVADLMASGNAAALAKASSVPFLLDGEIVALGEDVASFWEAAAKADLGMAGMKLDSVIPASFDDLGEELLTLAKNSGVALAPVGLFGLIRTIARVSV